MDAYKKLAKNAMIYTVANIGSKLVLVLMIPFYTYMLSTEQMGTADAIASIISLISPIMTLYFQDAVLRFCMEKDGDRVGIFSTAMVTVAVGSIFILMLSPVLLLFGIKRNIIAIIIMLTFVQGLNGILGQFSKAIDKNVNFAISGVLSTVVLTSSNILFLTVLKFKVEGYLLSIVLSYFASDLYLICSCKMWKYVRFVSVKKYIFKMMLGYSLPLIPNAVMWWIVNLSDRYMIIAFIGVGANGLYAVASRIPSLLNMINTIFNQAWQVSAIEERDNKERTFFSSNTFNIYMFASVMATLIVITLIRPTIELGVAPSFTEIWQYIPFLMYSTIFSGFASFLGSLYAVEKKTKNAMFSTLCSAGINIVLNVIFIPIVGINGAGFATLISMLVLFVYRAIDTKKYLEIMYDKRLIISSIILSAVQLLCYYCSSIIATTTGMLFVVIFACINKKYIMSVIGKIKGKFIKGNK